MPLCVVVGCSSRTSRKSRHQKKLEEGKSKITFHRFPTHDVKRRAVWVEKLRRANWGPSPYSTVCSLHFEEHYFDRTSLNNVRLREDAVPTIFPKTPTYLNHIKKEQCATSETGIELLSGNIPVDVNSTRLSPSASDDDSEDCMKKDMLVVTELVAKSRCPEKCQIMSESIPNK